jgi:DNA-binding response OmpR family regulator
LIKILLLEDDPILAKTLKKILEKNNYQVTWVRDGEDAASVTYDEKFNLYLFDINVPLFNGDDLLLSLREAGDKTPCILISALVDISSITKGFSSGADDYIKKPFDIDELLVRIKAKTSSFSNIITYKDFKYNIDDDILLYKDEEVFLSFTQKEILKHLFLSYPNPSLKEDLFELLEVQNDLALRVNISKIKQKIDIDIKNVRGVGYKLA